MNECLKGYFSVMLPLGGALLFLAWVFIHAIFIAKWYDDSRYENLWAIPVIILVLVTEGNIIFWLWYYFYGC